MIVCFGNELENPGAALFARKLGQGLSINNKVILLGSFQKIKATIKAQNFDFKLVQLPFNKKNSSILKFYNFYFRFGVLIKVLNYMIKKRAKVVNFHCLSGEIPLSSIVFAKLMRKFVIVSHHDFMAIARRKLYPRDLYYTSSNREKDTLKLITKHDNFLLKINRFIFNYFADYNIVISEMQGRIFQDFGFKNILTIENRINKCTCDITVPIESKHDILFAGRIIGKGYYELLEWLENKSNLRLGIAGDEILFNEAIKYVSEDRILYYGKVSNEEILKLLHQSNFVYVKSECLDVYPTILLEGIVHGSVVITSRNCGNYRMVERILPNLVVQEMTQLTDKDLFKYEGIWKTSESLKDLVNEITDFDEYVEKYQTLISLGLGYSKTNE